MDIMEYWKNEWNKVTDTRGVIDTQISTGQLTHNNGKICKYYFDVTGKLVDRQCIDENVNGIDRTENYIVITSDSYKDSDMSEDEKYFVTVPNRKAMEKMELLSKDLNNKIKVERGIVIMTDGSCSTSIAKGSECSISTSQWQPVFEEVKASGKKPAYIIHTHLTTGVEKWSQYAIESLMYPSDIDLNTSFYNDEIGVIVGWINTRNIPEYGKSTESSNYDAQLVFYRKKSNVPIYICFFHSFKKLVNSINS